LKRRPLLIFLKHRGQIEWVVPLSSLGSFSPISFPHQAQTTFINRARGSCFAFPYFSSLLFALAASRTRRSRSCFLNWGGAATGGHAAFSSRFKSSSSHITISPQGSRKILTNKSPLRQLVIGNLSSRTLFLYSSLTIWGLNYRHPGIRLQVILG